MKEQVSQAFMQYILPTLLTVIGSGAAYLLGLLAVYFKARAKDSKFFNVLNRVTTVTQAVVANVNVAIKEQLKTFMEDGVLSEQEKHLLKQTAMTSVKKTLGEQGMAELQSVMGLTADGANEFLSGVIEQAVTKAKINEAAASRP